MDAYLSDARQEQQTCDVRCINDSCTEAAASYTDCYCVTDLHRVPKKGDTKLMAVTLLILKQFSKKKIHFQILQ